MLGHKRHAAPADLELKTALPAFCPHIRLFGWSHVSIFG